MSFAASPFSQSPLGSSGGAAEFVVVEIVESLTAKEVLVGFNPQNMVFAEAVETAPATDIVLYAVDVTVPVTGVTIMVKLNTPLIWQPIDDTQDPNWVLIRA